MQELLGGSPFLPAPTRHIASSAGSLHSNLAVDTCPHTPRQPPGPPPPLHAQPTIGSGGGGLCRPQLRHQGGGLLLRGRHLPRGSRQRCLQVLPPPVLPFQLHSEVPDGACLLLHHLLPPPRLGRPEEVERKASKQAGDASALGCGLFRWAGDVPSSAAAARIAAACESQAQALVSKRAHLSCASCCALASLEPSFRFCRCMRLSDSCSSPASSGGGCKQWQRHRRGCRSGAQLSGAWWTAGQAVGGREMQHAGRAGGQQLTISVHSP